MWKWGLMIFISALVVIASISHSDPLCSESTRLKDTDYQRWVKAGGKDCDIYSTIFDK